MIALTLFLVSLASATNPGTEPPPIWRTRELKVERSDPWIKKDPEEIWRGVQAPGGSTSDPHRQAQSYIQCSLPNLLRFQARYSESHKGHSASGRRFSQLAGRFSPAGHNPSAGWGYALQCSPSVRAGGESLRRVGPFFLKKTTQLKPPIVGDVWLKIGYLLLT